MHFKFKAFNCCKVTTIPPFGLLIKRINIASFRQQILKREAEEDEMRFAQKTASYKTTNSTFLPILPLVRVKIPEDTDKAKFITFELKVRSGTGAGTPSYKKSMRTFEEGSPQEWMDVLTGLREIWKQNTVNGPTDRAATVVAILKGDSRTAFESSLEEVRVNPDDDDVPLVMTIEHIEVSLSAVTDIVFPFRALEVQKQWMTRYMKKPFDLSTKKMASALTRINNYLPSFPGGTQASKFSESEIVGLLEFALPNSWRKAMDLKGFVPSDNNKKALVDQCERIERNETQVSKDKEPHNDNNKNNKKNKFAKFENNKKKNGGEQVTSEDGQKYCKKCGHNDTHSTDRCFKLKKLAREAEQANGNGKAYAKPFSKRTFRKEINAMARRAGKHNGLEVFKSALKREQGKQEKRVAKKVTIAASAKKAPKSDESDSDSDESMHNLELPIPRKKRAQKTKKSIFDGLQDSESFDEDEGDNKATDEETAFLKSIDKEEAEMKETAGKTGSE